MPDRIFQKTLGESLVAILIGTEHGCRNEISTVKEDACGSCNAEVLYRISSRRLSRLLKNGRGGTVCCPQCGWSKFSLPSKDKIPRSLRALGSWFKKKSPESTKEFARGAIALHNDGSDGPDPMDLERELYSCLRCALLCMAAIDGEVHPTEVMAISNIYRSVTGDRVDMGTLEQQAVSSAGKHEKMLDCLDCLSPYLNYEGKLKFLRAVGAVATADGRIDRTEANLLEDIVEALNLQRSDLKTALKTL